MKTLNEINYMLDPNIDERIKNLCQQAENNNILSLSKKNNLQTPKIPNFSYKNDFSKNNYSFLDKTVTKSEENLNIVESPQKNVFINLNKEQDSKQILSNRNNSQFIKDNNALSLKIKPNRNKSWNKYKFNNQNFKNKTINLNKEMIDSINSKIMLKSNNVLSPKSLKFGNNINNLSDDIVNYNSQLLISQSHINRNPSSKYNSFLSNSSSLCFECDLHKLINDKNIYNKDLNYKAKENKEINNIILTGKILLQKNKLKKAYILLSSIIKKGINHPDLFYLYGEVCRKLKYMEDAEKYLLACLDYKNCSQYVYLSLAQLYKEIGQIKYSKNFYKKCLPYFKKGSINFNLAINYMKLNKPLKAINYLTEAINLDPRNPLYYKYRSQIYQELGHKDLYLKDIYKYNQCIINN